MSYGEHRGFSPNFEICKGCFVHDIILGVGCYVRVKKKTKHVVVFVRGVFCPCILIFGRGV